MKPRRAAVVLALGIAIAVLAACGRTAPSAPTSAPASASPPAGTTPAGCRIARQEGRLRSDLLTQLDVATIGLADVITFRFGPPSRPDVAGTGRLEAAEPPFVQDGSGEPVEVDGQHHLVVVLDGMLIHDDVGRPYFQGERTVRPGLPAVRQVERTGMFEGIIGFVVGYDGPGCVQLLEDAAAGTLTITIGH